MNWAWIVVLFHTIKKRMGSKFAPLKEQVAPAVENAENPDLRHLGAENPAG